MANPYFQFKQFTVRQEKCSLKVSTDSCLLGAWFACKKEFFNHALDIGSGTGLLMLMLAQKHHAFIDGIEIDPDCFLQLQENIGQSPWSNRCRSYHGDVRLHQFAHGYDFIITNPPFYENQLPSPHAGINLARHASELTLAELMDVIQRLLLPGGSFGILLPYARLAEMEALAMTAGFHLQENVLVRHSPAHSFSRCILHFAGSKPQNQNEIMLNIYQEGSMYSKEFIALMKDYYLKI